MMAAWPVELEVALHPPHLQGYYPLLTPMVSGMKGKPWLFDADQG